jgi:transposase
MEETVASRKGRPNYPLEFKRQLAQAAREPKVSVAKLALTHGINANMLFTWRRQHRAGLFNEPLPRPVTLLPVSICNAKNHTVSGEHEPEAPAAATHAATSTAGTIEITFPGVVVRLDGCVDSATLRTVVQSLHP